MTRPQQRLINALAFQLGQLVRYGSDLSEQTKPGDDLCFTLIVAGMEDTIRKFQRDTKRHPIIFDETPDEEL